MQTMTPQTPEEIPQAPTPSSEISWPVWPRWLSAALLLVAFGWLMYRVRGILLPFIVGGIAAYVLNPVIDALEKREWSRMRAILIVFAIFLLLFLAVALYLLPAVIDQVQQLISSYDDYVAGFQKLMEQAGGRLEGLLRRWGGSLPSGIQEAFKDVGEKTRAYLPTVLQNVLAWFGHAATIVLLLVATPIVTFWLLRDYHHVGRWLLLLVPVRQRETTARVVREMNSIAGSYLLGLAILCSIATVVAIVSLLAFHVNYAFLLGLLVGMGYAIPYFGVPTASATVALICFLTGHPWVHAVVLVGIFLGMNVIFDYLVSPKLIGERVGLHPLMVIFALLAAGELFGFVGMLVAVPLAASVKVVLLHFFPDLLGGNSESPASDSES